MSSRRRDPFLAVLRHRTEQQLRLSVGCGVQLVLLGTDFHPVSSTATRDGSPSSERETF